jgi:hypothetical protein
MELITHADRRDHRRERIEIEVDIWNEQFRTKGVVFDLSGSGLSVVTSETLPNNSEMHVSFEIPESVRVNCDARVVWSSASRRAGLRFANVSEVDRKALAKWMGDQRFRAACS